MYKLLMQRYKEVLARKHHGIKLNWITPLSKDRQQAVELAYKSEVAGKAHVAI